MNRLETPDDLYSFITTRGDVHSDPILFWDALGVSHEAIVEACITAGQALGITPPQAQTCMEIGAMLALRWAEENKE